MTDSYRIKSKPNAKSASSRVEPAQLGSSASHRPRPPDLVDVPIGSTVPNGYSANRPDSATSKSVTQLPRLFQQFPWKAIRSNCRVHLFFVPSLCIREGDGGGQVFIERCQLHDFVEFVLDSAARNSLPLTHVVILGIAEWVAVKYGSRKANLSSPCGAPSERRVRRWRTQTLNRLEALPLDILVKILSKVDHSDLKQLLLVSKTVNGATLIARESHFVFSTPISKSLFKKQSNKIDSDLGIINEEAPHAPNQQRVARSRLNGVQLSSVAIALFT
ncbi:F-box protein [Musa troglodytarum]|uniref:F-box protein n=1 Tax=Musa troglodytarum TaxID=320322 RepID=A0A9E7GEU6_9LILI|nr:F-box protein [Musa troglodytarum]